MEQGKVWLVGAGPGDPGLLTLEGRRVLEQADVVVYDRLVGGVLEWVPQTAERIYVGKEAGRHIVPQDEINEILLRQAKLGKRVVRLKGGDPFLFGRGGEELALLAAHNIPFAVVPGVTSAIAVPAYNGIPVTHRALASSLHIITAHKKAGDRLPLNFKALATLEGTLVFLMGVSSLKEICQNLIESGKPGDTPAAILEQGTLSGQRRVTGTLETLLQRAKEQGIGAPAVIVVGAVCTLSEALDWAARRPLHGAKVLVTRSRKKAGTLTARLRELGAEVGQIPAIDTVLLDKTPAWDQVKTHLRDFSWLVFSSPSAVEHLFQLLQREKMDIRALGPAKLAAVGPATVQALESRGLLVDCCPATYCGESLAEALFRQVMPGEQVLAFQPENQESGAVTALRQRGAAVTGCPIYKTVYESGRLEVDDTAIAAFTSGSCVEGFGRMAGRKAAGMTAVCIGAKTAAKACALGMTVFTAREATIDSLVEAIVKVYREGKGTT